MTGNRAVSVEFSSVTSFKGTFLNFMVWEFDSSFHVSLFFQISYWLAIYKLLIAYIKFCICE
jgi:hypothetical protein